MESLQRSYTYDGMGNRTQSTSWDEVGGQALSRTYSANGLNQYQATMDSAGNAQSFQYDQDGNMAFKEDDSGQTLYAYDAENRLISATPVMPGPSDRRVEFVYDFAGRRVMKWIKYWAGSDWVEESSHAYIYNGWNLIRETVTQNSEEKHFSYVWGLDRSETLQSAGGVGGLLARLDHQAGKTFNYLYDVLYDTRQLLDMETGQIAASYQYDPYGNLVESSGPEADANPFRYSTKYHDAETGLYYYGHRYYSPDLGRWTNRDPMGESGGVNLYGFVTNSPVVFYDYLGLCNLGEIAREVIKAFFWDTLKAKVTVKLGKTLAKMALSSVADGPLPIGELIAIGLGLYDAYSLAKSIYNVDKVIKELKSAVDDIFRKFFSDGYFKEKLREKSESCCGIFAKGLGKALGQAIKKNGLKDAKKTLNDTYLELKRCCGIAKDRNITNNSDVPDLGEIARTRAAILRNSEGKKKSQATSIAYDTKTGKIYVGDSRDRPEDIHIILKNQMPEESAYSYPVNNCAEFSSVNKALKDREDAKLSDIVVHTVKTADGTDFKRCKNCRRSIDGAIVTSDPK